jgi:trans-aconitate 2-methyltransferase
MWDPSIYGRYGDERSRPFFDLTRQVGAENPRTVVDLGCGTGELTATLAGRWPGARVSGIDSSREMIAKAGTLGDRIDFTVGDIARWEPPDGTDVIVTNAALQWVPGHQEMLSGWFARLAPGGWFAMQVPGNFAAASHRTLRQLATMPPYAEKLHGKLRADPVDDAAGYAARFLAAGAVVDAWETEYVHLLPATETEHPVLRWMEGTALRPVRAALDDRLWEDFRAELCARLIEVYPARSGHVAFPFRRIFVVAHKPEGDQ